MDLSDLRQDYTKEGLSEADLFEDPFIQFEKWFREAETCELDEPNAMCLATVGSDGRPSTRIVLLKDFSPKGLTFFTNYESRKSKEMMENSEVATNFLWLPLQRQVNITGVIEKLSREESLKYFLSRPLGSRLGAWTSPQSQVITSRQVLEARWDQMKRQFANGEVPLPDNWGGYRIVPRTFEFWQGRPSRLHDRFLFQKGVDQQWVINRLAP